MFALLYKIVAGFLIGLLARFLLPGDQKMGLIMTTLLGIAGSVVGGFVANKFLGDNDGVGWIGATITAMILLYAGHRWNSNR